MKIQLFGKNSQNLESLTKDLQFKIVDSNPDVIISYGGDGTLLSAERQYPGIPKLSMRNSAVCKKCPSHEEKTVLEKLIAGKLELKNYKKIETSILYKDLFALNDFVIRNKEPMHSIRFTVSAGNLLIGDGIVVSTSFGSTGYFKSITGKTFDTGLPAGRQGFGVAFNNTTEKAEALHFKNTESITFELVRGNATLSFDNSPDIFTIDEGSKLIFKLSSQVAKIYEAEILRCPDCVVTRG